MQGRYGKENNFLSICLLIAVALSVKIVHALPGNAIEGQAIYQRLCVGCHGTDGRGGPMAAMLKIPPRDLTDPAYMDTRSDEQLFTAIRYGGEAVERSAAMPAFSDQLSEETTWDTVVYVRTLISTQTTSGSVSTASELKIARLHVMIWPEYDDPRVLIIIRGEMSPRQAFPTTVKLPIPKGAEIIGAGMISESDELLLHPHEIVAGDTEDFLTLNLPVPRFFVEFYYAPFDSKQVARRFVYSIAAPYPIELLEVDIQQPTETTEFTTTPQPMEQVTDRQGFKHRQFVYRDLAVGATRQFTVAYIRTATEPSVAKQQPAPSPTSPQTAQRSPLGRSEAAVTLLALVTVLFAGFAWLWTRRQARQDSCTITATAQAAPLAPTPSVTTTPPGQPNFCSQCGNRVGSEHHFCARCGHALHP